jgi:hypothetical protein
MGFLATTLIKAKKLGLNIVEIPSVEFKRQSGESNLKTVQDGMKILKTIMKQAIRN